MSSNHYGHIPPPPANLHPVTGNRPDSDHKPFPKTNDYWTFNQSNEFENREKYMEMAMAEELYNRCDNAVSQNEIPDDEPCPPPGLRRLVTGQTVSFDESPNSPPFDRIVPGEGSAFNSYPAQSSLPPVSDATVSNRIVSGSNAFDNNPVPSQVTSANDVAVSKRFVSGSANVEYSSVPAHMFGPVPQTKLDKQEAAQFFNSNNFGTAETHVQDFLDNGSRTENTPDESASHQPQVKHISIPPFNASKSQQQQQPQPYSMVTRIQPPVNTTSPFQTYPHRAPATAQENFVQFENTLPQRTYDNYAKSKNETADPVAATASSEREDQRTMKIASTGRMTVEGATNVPQPKIVSTSTPVHSPSYDHWYENKVPNNYEFSSVEDAKKLHSNRTPDDKCQIMQPTTMTTTTPFTPVTASNTSMHSKTASMSSNTSSINEMSSYQQNESHADIDVTQKRKETFGSADKGASKFNHANIRPDEIGAKSKSAEISMHDLWTNDKSSSVYEEGDECTNVQNKMYRDDRNRYNNNPIIESEEPPENRFDREPVPGARNTAADVHPRMFPKPSGNASTVYDYQYEKTAGNYDDERDETERYSDSDDKRSTSQRAVPAYNYYTIPAARKNHSKSYSGVDPRYGTRARANVNPSLETRMVVGKTSSDVPFKNTSGRVYDDEYVTEDHDLNRERNRQLEEERGRRIRRDLNRNEKERQKPNRGRPRNESDEEYPESLGHGYDVSPDRGSRSYREKHRRDSPTRFKKPSQRMDCESSITQDDSFYEDDDEDRETYRTYSSRRPARSRPYKPYYADSVERDWDRSYYDRSYWDRYQDDVHTRSSRPSSRSGSRDLMEYNNAARHSKLPFYNTVEKSNSRAPSNEIQYWTEWRHVDPKGYMRWFRHAYPEEYAKWYHSRYMKPKIYQDDRRGSGHSGHSSINNDSISVNEKLIGVKDLSVSGDSENICPVNEERSSPFKFQMPHAKGLFNSLGQLIVVNESCPKEGLAADVDVYEISAPDDDPDVVEFMNFTGPFIVGETHVNTVSEFVRYHADSASTSSEKLLYLLIDLIIKLRGVTDGIAISELLMSAYRESQELSTFPPRSEPPPTVSKSGSAATALSEHDILEKYTNLLLQGNKNAALDWAINHKLWGHAFLLASKIGSKHYSNVLVKFDASIPMNNPLKTLYQLYSNQIPQAATACADEKWGDWRPHLAMILSNPTPDNKVDRAAIITLGDSLFNKDLFASHFCYLTAEATFEVWNKPSAKLSLLSLRNGVDHFGVDTSNHAILLTQTYEFAKRLQRKEFIIPALLPYKYLLAVRLIDYGKCDIALQYLESVATGLENGVEDVNRELASNVLELAESIKFADSKPFVAGRSVDPPWLTTLRELVAATAAEFQSSNEPNPPKDVPLVDMQTLKPLKQLQLPQALPVQQQKPPQQSERTQEQIATGVQQPLMFTPQQPPMMITPMQTQPTSVPLLPQDPQQSWEMNSYATKPHNSFIDYGPSQSTQPISLNSEASFDVDEANCNQFSKGDDQQNEFSSPWNQSTQQAQISMHSTSNSFYDDGPPKPTPNATQALAAAKETDKDSKEKKKEKENSGWLGTLNKLIRPKNQMKLPDDKDPSIVWDDSKKQWVDKTAEGNDSVSAIQPPPRASELRPRTTHVADHNATMPPYSGNNIAPQATPLKPVVGMQGNGATLPNAAPPSGSNIYKLQKGRGMKANYVNVLSQNITSQASGAPAAPNLMMDSSSSTIAPPNVNYFIPSSG